MRAPVPEWEPLRLLIGKISERYYSMSGNVDLTDAQELRDVVQAIKATPRKIVKRDGYVYLFQDQNGMCKIGMTTDMAQRGRTLEDKHGPLKLLASIRTKDRYKLERELHAKYAHRCHHLEWFILSDDDIKEIKSLVRV